MKEKSLFEGYEFNHSEQGKENWLGEPTMGEYTPIDDIPMGGPEWRQHVVLDRFGKIVEEKQNESSISD